MSDKKIYMRLGEQSPTHEKEDEKITELKAQLKEHLGDEVLENIIDGLDFSLIDGVFNIQIPEPTFAIFLEAIKTLSQKLLKEEELTK